MTQKTGHVVAAGISKKRVLGINTQSTVDKGISKKKTKKNGR